MTEKRTRIKEKATNGGVVSMIRRLWWWQSPWSSTKHTLNVWYTNTNQTQTQKQKYNPSLPWLRNNKSLREGVFSHRGWEKEREERTREVWKREEKKRVWEKRGEKKEEMVSHRGWEKEKRVIEFWKREENGIRREEKWEGEKNNS